MLIIGIILIVSLVAGVVLYVVAKAPKLVPKKRIVEAILAASDELFQYRQELRSLIGESFNLYMQHDASLLIYRYGTLDRRRQDMMQKLATTEQDLAPYKTSKAHARFYTQADATIGVLKQAAEGLAEIKQDSQMFEAQIINLARLNTLTQDYVMTAYVADDDATAAHRVGEHITGITALAEQTLQQFSTLQLQTNEYRNVAQSVGVALKVAEGDYVSLQDLLEASRYDQYRSASQALPYFFNRFDTASYESIIVAPFFESPEESYINDLRPYLYS